MKRDRMNGRKKEGVKENERKREKERGRVCICDVYIVLRKKERELFQGTPCYYLPPIIPNNNSMFKMQHQKKKGNYRYHEIKYSVRKHEDVSLFRTFLVLRKGERHIESYFCGSNFSCSFFLTCIKKIWFDDVTMRKHRKVNDLWKKIIKKMNSLEFTVLRHKITVLAPFYSHPTTDSSFHPTTVSLTCIRSCYRASNLFAIHCKHDRFCSQVQVAVYRVQMLLYLRHFGQRCKYLFRNLFRRLS